MPNTDHLRIQAVILGIPTGCVTSYGEIAHRSGLPGRARLVGRVLREAGEQAALPWHRVVRADGRLAFASGSKAFREQKRRLAAEGVTLNGVRVDLSLFGWQRDLDAELWSPDAWVHAPRSGH
ncbi:MGMT family protein [Dokdonella sp.]|uniref:MGMT family protein n=1 Tax=Dokdonella sp. TaxID=2291710 RepID=UPI003C4EB4DB